LRQTKDNLTGGLPKTNSFGFFDGNCAVGTCTYAQREDGAHFLSLLADNFARISSDNLRPPAESVFMEDLCDDD
jgi:hypothetical protein